MKATQVAVAVVGAKNLTKITGLRPLNDTTLNSFARTVAKKEPGRIYYVIECSESGLQRKKGDPLYVWHVGEGFEHRDGWWVETAA